LIENGVNVLVGADKNSIIKETKTMLAKPSNFSIDLYGSGKACEKIAKALLKLL